MFVNFTMDFASFLG